MFNLLQKPKNNYRELTFLQFSKWTTTFNAKAYRQYFQHPDVMQSNDAYMSRVRQTQTDYHTRPFVHAVTPNSCDNRCILPVDPSIVGQDSETIARSWLGKLAPSVPSCNRECGIGAAHAKEAFGIDPVHDGLRVIFIKAYKVASTSSASIFYRLAHSHSMPFLGFLEKDDQTKVCRNSYSAVAMYSNVT